VKASPNIKSRENIYILKLARSNYDFKLQAMSVFHDHALMLHYENKINKRV